MKKPKKVPTNVESLWQRVRELQAALDALKEEIQDVVDDIEFGARLREHEAQPAQPWEEVEAELDEIDEDEEAGAVR